MTSALAEQLLRLKTPQSQLFHSGVKSKASLLFDPREAANIERETFFGIGLNGLRELTTISSVFAKFETTLFSDASVGVERALLSKEENGSLDFQIREFLYLVSPYVQ